MTIIGPTGPVQIHVSACSNAAAVRIEQLIHRPSGRIAHGWLMEIPAGSAKVLAEELMEYAEFVEKRMES